MGQLFYVLSLCLEKVVSNLLRLSIPAKLRLIFSSQSYSSEGLPEKRREDPCSHLPNKSFVVFLALFPENIFVFPVP